MVVLLHTFFFLSAAASFFSRRSWNAKAGGDGADQNGPLHVFPGVCQVTVVQNKYNTIHDNTDNPFFFFQDMIVREYHFIKSGNKK